VLTLYRRRYDPQRPVVCFDEKSLQWLANPAAYPPRAARPGQPRRQDYEYVRHGTRNIFLWVIHWSFTWKRAKRLFIEREDAAVAAATQQN
jgi:hypothetical protein